MEITVLTVFLAALATALATGLGALPVWAMRGAGPVVLSRSSALAAGIMLAASFSLIVEGMDISTGRTLIGVLLGVALVLTGHWWVDRHDVQIGEIAQADAKRMVLIVGVMTVHSAAEGIGVGVSFAGREGLAWYITVAIAVHNIPEGIAISLVLVPRGISILAAAGWSIFSSLPQPLLAVPAFLAVSLFKPLLPVGLGLAAGAMIWMVFADLFPDSLKHGHANTAGGLVVAAFTAMLAFQYFVLA